ncbi:hypothetical protein [Planotetraspora silvatica]|uniref:hypothetical protein n=1 Tax=Planotetraspora silvatica TaxID=234614 RepID=UPI0019521884|nr:hypothetical protein [Planotetraspora silvatica]
MEEHIVPTYNPLDRQPCQGGSPARRTRGGDLGLRHLIAGYPDDGEPSVGHVTGHVDPDRRRAGRR